MQALTLRQQVGQLLVISFHGTSAPRYVLEILRARRAAGVILFGENVGSRAQLAALTAGLRRAGGPGTLVAADQEGGAVRVVPFAGPSTAQPEQGSAAAVRRNVRTMGRGLKRAGVDVALAPVADVAAGDDSVMRSRAFPGAAPHVASLVGAAVAAARAAGVAVAVKHFPGLGAATANTDAGSVTVIRSRRRLLGSDLLPFGAAIAAGAPIVMASHALYPALDAGHIASQSRAILGGLLRGRLGFGGVIVTDSMEARAVIRRSSIGEAAVRSVSAGADLLLLTGPGSYRLVYPRLLAQARRSPEFRHSVRRAAARVLALERRLRAGGRR